MPNWVSNTLSIEGSPVLISYLKEQMNRPFTVSHENWDMDSNSMKSMDVSYSNPVFSFWNIIKPTDMEEYCKQSQDTNTKLDWYSWNNNNWGVKWDVAIADGNVYSDTTLDRDEPNGENHLLVYRFDTAWGFPDEVLKTLSAQYPDLLFTLSYQEETGWGGEHEYLRGEQLDGSEYNWICYECDYMELGDPADLYDEDEGDFVCPICQPSKVELSV